MFLICFYKLAEAGCFLPPRLTPTALVHFASLFAPSASFVNPKLNPIQSIHPVRIHSTFSQYSRRRRRSSPTCTSHSAVCRVIAIGPSTQALTFFPYVPLFAAISANPYPLSPIAPSPFLSRLFPYSSIKHSSLAAALVSVCCFPAVVVFFFPLLSSIVGARNGRR